MALRSGTPPPELGPDALELLSAQNWRGNIRELRNVLEQAAMRSDSQPIEVSALEEVLREVGQRRCAFAPQLAWDRSSHCPNGRAARRLATAGGSGGRGGKAGHPRLPCKPPEATKWQAAKLLGISRAKLYERLEMDCLKSGNV
jgi:DNA-binding NtrC family response regulator